MQGSDCRIMLVFTNPFPLNSRVPIASANFISDGKFQVYTLMMDLAKYRFTYQKAYTHICTPSPQILLLSAHVHIMNFALLKIKKYEFHLRSAHIALIAYMYEQTTKGLLNMHEMVAKNLVYSLSAKICRGLKNEIRCTHARTN